MAALAVPLWVLRSLARRSSAWVLLGLLVAQRVLGEVLAPYRVGAYEDPSRPAFEVAFAAAVLGAGFAVDVVGGHPTLFRACSPARRTALEGAGLAAGAAAACGLALALPLASGAWATWGLREGLALACMVLHVSGIALLVLRGPAGRAVRWGMLLSFAWVLPILSVTDKGEPGPFTHLLGAPLHLPPEPAPLAELCLPALAPIGALWLAAGLLAAGLPGSPRSATR